MRPLPLASEGVEEVRERAKLFHSESRAPCSELLEFPYTSTVSQTGKLSFFPYFCDMECRFRYISIVIVWKFAVFVLLKGEEPNVFHVSASLPQEQYLSDQGGALTSLTYCSRPSRLSVNVFGAMR